VVGLDAELKYTAGLVSAACFAATGPTVPSNNIAGLGLGGQLPNVLAKDLSKKKNGLAMEGWPTVSSPLYFGGQSAKP